MAGSSMVHRSAQELLVAANTRLVSAFRVPAIHAGDRLGPVSQLIYCLLHVGSPTMAADAAFRRLTAGYWNWDEVRNASIADIHQVTGTLDRTGAKARTVSRVLSAIERLSDGRRLSLDILARLPDRDALALLCGIDGVEPAIAAEVLLMSSLHRRILPATSARMRVSTRLGVVQRGLAPDEEQAALSELVPTRWKAAECERDHAATTALATRFCIPGVPRCAGCPLSDICLSATIEPRLGRHT